MQATPDAPGSADTPSDARVAVAEAVPVAVADVEPVPLTLESFRSRFERLRALSGDHTTHQQQLLMMKQIAGQIICHLDRAMQRVEDGCHVNAAYAADMDGLDELAKLVKEVLEHVDSVARAMGSAAEENEAWLDAEGSLRAQERRGVTRAYPVYKLADLATVHTQPGIDLGGTRAPGDLVHALIRYTKPDGRVCMGTVESYNAPLDSTYNVDTLNHPQRLNGKGTLRYKVVVAPTSVQVYVTSRPTQRELDFVYDRGRIEWGEEAPPDPFDFVHLSSLKSLSRHVVDAMNDKEVGLFLVKRDEGRCVGIAMFKAC